jgi:Holliday junction resolvase RusA-like endonuclease
MTPIRFAVPAVPVAQPRQRHRIAGKGSRQFVQNYIATEAPVNAFKAAVMRAAEAVYDGPVLDGPVCVDMVFLLPRPKNMMWKTKPMLRVMHTKRPDLDNLQKAVLDALSGRLWRDDAQVCIGHAVKLIASGDEQPHVELCVMDAVGQYDEYRFLALEGD